MPYYTDEAGDKVRLEAPVPINRAYLQQRALEGRMARPTEYETNWTPWVENPPMPTPKDPDYAPTLEMPYAPLSGSQRTANLTRTQGVSQGHREAAPTEYDPITPEEAATSPVSRQLYQAPAFESRAPGNVLGAPPRVYFRSKNKRTLWLV